jgi:hypothetical protein
MQISRFLKHGVHRHPCGDHSGIIPVTRLKLEFIEVRVHQSGLRKDLIQTLWMTRRDIPSRVFGLFRRRPEHSPTSTPPQVPQMETHCTKKIPAFPSPALRRHKTYYDRESDLGSLSECLFSRLTWSAGQVQTSMSPITVIAELINLWESTCSSKSQIVHFHIRNHKMLWFPFCWIARNSPTSRDTWMAWINRFRIGKDCNPEMTNHARSEFTIAYFCWRCKVPIQNSRSSFMFLQKDKT